MPDDRRDHPSGLGNEPMQDVAERQFRTRTTGQDTGRKPHETAPTAEAGPDHPQVNQPPKQPGKRVEHAYRGGAGHAQSPVWEEKDGKK